MDWPLKTYWQIIMILLANYSTMAAAPYAFGYSNTTVVERQPIYTSDVWYNISQIPQAPSSSPSAYCQQKLNVSITPTSNPLQFACTGLSNMIPGNWGNWGSSGAGSLWQPFLTDSNGQTVVYNPAVWVADSDLQIIQFVETPSSLGYKAPYTLTYWQYTGQTASTVTSVLTASAAIIQSKLTGNTLPAYVIVTDSSSVILNLPPASSSKNIQFGIRPLCDLSNDLTIKTNNISASDLYPKGLNSAAELVHIASGIFSQFVCDGVHWYQLF